MSQPNSNKLIKDLFGGRTEAEILTFLQDRGNSLTDCDKPEMAHQIFELTQIRHNSAFPRSENIDPEQSDTLTTTVTANIYIPRGAEEDGVSLRFDNDFWHIGIWLYNDSGTRAIEPFNYSETENRIEPTSE